MRTSQSTSQNKCRLANPADWPKPFLPNLDARDCWIQMILKLFNPLPRNLPNRSCSSAVKFGWPTTHTFAHSCYSGWTQQVGPLFGVVSAAVYSCSPHRVRKPAWVVWEILFHALRGLDLHWKWKLPGVLDHSGGPLFITYCPVLMSMFSSLQGGTGTVTQTHIPFCFTFLLVLLLPSFLSAVCSFPAFPIPPVSSFLVQSINEPSFWKWKVILFPSKETETGF